MQNYTFVKRRPRAGSICTLSQYWSAVLKRSSRRREQSKKFWLPMGTGETAHLTTKERGGLSCFVWWAERLDVAWSSGIFHPPINKLPKANGSTPQRGSWDSQTRGEGRQVSKKTDIYDRGHYETSCKDEPRHHERSTNIAHLFLFHFF